MESDQPALFLGISKEIVHHKKFSVDPPSVEFPPTLLRLNH